MKTTDEHIIFQVLNTFLENLPQKFQRERKDGVWSPQLTAFAMLLMSLQSHSGGYESILATLRMAREDLLSCPSHQSSFCRARKKLCQGMLDTAWGSMRKVLESLLGDYCPVVHGHRLVAIDGVWINAKRSRKLFKELRKRKRGRPPKDPKGQPQILVVVLLDVLTKTPIAWDFLSPGEGERKAAMRLCAHLNKRTILLADRGFPSRIILEELTKRETSYIIRMTSGSSAFSEIQEFQRTSGRDRLVKVKAGQGKNSQQLTTRIVRGHVMPNHPAKKDDWTLLTNLKGKKRWSRTMILELYHERWSIEVFFRELKTILNADSFHSQSLDGIKQELTMSMLAASLIAAMDMLAHIQTRGRLPQWNDRTKKRCNRTTLRTVLFQILLRDPRCQSVKQLLDQELGIAGKNAQKQRPNRIYPRICKSFVGKWKNGFKRRSA